MTTPLVSVLVVNFNRQDLLKECLGALNEQDYPNLEVVVVDNGSVDGSVDYLRTYKAKNTKLVLLDSNTGFTGGNIAGLDQAKGTYIALVNNDALLDPGWIRTMVEALERHPDAGIAASRIVRYGAPDKLDSAGDGMTTSSRGYKLGEGRHPDSMAEPTWVFGASAAAALYRKSMIDHVGFLDPTFFFNCEDTDLSFRAQLMGWKCLYVPQARARHHVNASCGQLRSKHIYYWSRNCELLWLKNMPLSLMLRYLPHRVFHESCALASNLFRGTYVPQMLLGKLAVLPLLPHALRERRRIQREMRISVRELESRLTPLFSVRFLWRKRVETPRAAVETSF